ncbi:acyl-CoA thioesterase [Flocculibacter collagenilyticus]|uniref:acyl-CoA thioesterase n=1 Tax=Flocculibacter collagenilyticus TaxID=2744479 RepID=UPI0018F3F9C8|nr:acyl-CoA thioesterase [Flocculibacter collagenilyticus]
MNLIFRMIHLLIASFFKPRLPVIKPKNSLDMRVLPNDLDINMHMNNGRYLTICDLSRVDMFIRTGLAKTMYKKGWIPVVAEHTMKYKKPLKLFQKYTVTMEIVEWDEKKFRMQHTFWVKDRVVAEGISLGCVLSKSGVIPPEEVIKTVSERLEEKNASVG